MERLAYMLYGTKEKQVKLSPFLQETTRAIGRFVAEQQRHDGKRFGLTSTSGSQEKEIGYHASSAQEINVLKALILGKYGTGFKYFSHPESINILHPDWSNPYLMAYSGTRFDKYADAQAIDTPDNDIELPVNGLLMHLIEDAAMGEGWRWPFTFLIPDEMSLAYGIKGNVTDTLSFEMTWGQYTIDLDINEDFTTIWNGILSRNDYPGAGNVATIILKGDGILTLYGMQMSYTNQHAILYSGDHIERAGNQHFMGTGLCGCEVLDSGISWIDYAHDTNYAMKINNFTFVEQEWAREAI